MSGSSHILSAGVYSTKDYNLTPLQQLPLQLDSKGNLKVTGSNVAPPLATYVFVTDGTNTQPTLDAPDRSGYVQVTDGTNIQPTLDDKTRGGYIYLTDGDQVADINENNALKVVLTPSPKPMTASAIEADADRGFVITLKFSLASKNTLYNILYFRNPVGSGKNVYVRKFSVSNVTSANLFNITMHTNPTVTSLGIPVTINNAKIGSLTTSACLAYNGNTVSSSTGTDFASVSGSGEQNALDFDYGVIVQPNNSLLFTGTAFDNTQTILINLVFAEINQ